MRARFGIRLIGAITAGLVAAVVILDAPAWAHIQVTADKPQAGATNVTVSFNGEAESTTAGLKSEQIFLPTGITPDMVSLASAPTGWTLTKSTDNVTIGGTALPIGTDAKYAILITKLPTNASELVFKTIETYANGDVDRWIDLQPPGQPEPEHPAPTLKLAAAPAATTPAATTAPAASTASTSSTAAAADTGGNGWILAVVIVAVIVAAVGALALWARRRTPSSR